MPQQKKTEPVNTELQEISEEWLMFARLLAQGVNQSEAYRLVYGKHLADNVVWANASRLKNDDRVKLWIECLRNEYLSKETYTLDAHIKDLDNLANEAKNAGNYGAAVNAKVNVGKALGHYTEKHEINVNNKGADLFLESLKEDTKEVKH